MKSISSTKVIDISPDRWICVYAKLSEDTKKRLKKYYKSIYPRDYVNRLVAAIEDENVQFNKTISG